MALQALEHEGNLHPQPDLRYRTFFPHRLEQCRSCHSEDAWCEFEVRTVGGWQPLCLDCAEFVTDALFWVERDPEAR